MHPEEPLGKQLTNAQFVAYRSTADGDFAYHVDRISGSMRLHSIEYTLDIDALYRDAGVP